MAKKRTPIKGLGDDAWFKQPGEGASSHEDQDTSIPVRQQGGKTVRQQDSIPVRQQDDMTAKQQDSMPVTQRLVKATFYVTPEHVTMLEELRLKRLKAGEKTDKSELVRQAIDLLARQQDGIPSKQ